MTELVEIQRPGEVIVIRSALVTEVIEISASPGIEVIERAEQGPRGPPGIDVFDDDLVLLYQIYKL